MPIANRITICTSCSRRSMCVSHDDGLTFNCNRCAKAFRLGVEDLYEAEKTIAKDSLYGETADEPKNVPVTMKPDVSVSESKSEPEKKKSKKKEKKENATETNT